MCYVWGPVPLQRLLGGKLSAYGAAFSSCTFSGEALLSFPGEAAASSALLIHSDVPQREGLLFTGVRPGNCIRGKQPVPCELVPAALRWPPGTLLPLGAL